jgi:hypothetical protein
MSRTKGRTAILRSHGFPDPPQDGLKVCIMAPQRSPHYTKACTLTCHWRRLLDSGSQFEPVRRIAYEARNTDSGNPGFFGSSCYLLFVRGSRTSHRGSSHGQPATCYSSYAQGTVSTADICGTCSRATDWRLILTGRVSRVLLNVPLCMKAVL